MSDTLSICRRLRRADRRLLISGPAAGVSEPGFLAGASMGPSSCEAYSARLQGHRLTLSFSQRTETSKEDSTLTTSPPPAAGPLYHPRDLPATTPTRPPAD